MHNLDNWPGSLDFWTTTAISVNKEEKEQNRFGRQFYSSIAPMNRACNLIFDLFEQQIKEYRIKIA